MDRVGGSGAARERGEASSAQRATGGDGAPIAQWGGRTEEGADDHGILSDDHDDTSFLMCAPGFPSHDVCDGRG